ncbi:MAG: SDR family oxidoreductase [Dehalococcoidales bacterium]|nr:SDR family oxidoreductase [Dehalococcoidales bacterium]
MKVLVLGGSGATGSLVIRQLLDRQIETRIIIRENAEIPPDLRDNPRLEILRGNISEMGDREIAGILKNCTAVVSCLGHNLTFKGLFGKPRNLVSGTVRRIHRILEEQPGDRVKLVLMNTTAFHNKYLNEKISIAERIILTLLFVLLPPHRDNVQAAAYLIEHTEKATDRMEWVTLRPDTLVNADEVSPYAVYESPVRSPIFNAGTTSRINVSHILAELITDEDLWSKWRYRTPVVYNC